MTRSEFDDIRAHIAAQAGCANDELIQLARELLDDLEQVRMREAVLRSSYVALLTAARATVAAQSAGNPAPLVFLEHELARHGQLPSDDQMSGDPVQRVLADAATTQSLIPPLNEPAPRRSTRGTWARRCGGVSRTLRR